MGDTQILTRASDIKLATHNVSPPSGLYVQINDVLQITLQCSIANIAVSIRLRLLLPDGSISLNSWDVISGPAIQQNNFQFGLAEGYILSANVYTVSPRSRGQLFATLQINRGAVGSNLFGQTLCRGYLTPQAGIFYPFGGNGYSVEGFGQFRNLIGATPAAGAEIAESVPLMTAFRPLTFIFTLTTTATVADRHVKLIFDDGVNIFSMTISPTVQQASLTYTYIFATLGASTPVAVQNFVQTPLVSGVLLKAQTRMRTVTTNLQAGDTYTQVLYLVESFMAV